MASCYEHCNKPYGFIEDGNSLNQPTVKNDSGPCCYLVWIRYRGKIRGNTILVPASLGHCKMTIDTSIVALLSYFFFFLPFLPNFHIWEQIYTNRRQKVRSYKIFHVIILWVTRITLCIFRWVTIFRRKKQPHYLGYHSLNINRRQRLISHTVSKTIW
jgi:hypothetical protein